jgi:hypothetical protein
MPLAGGQMHLVLSEGRYVAAWFIVDVLFAPALWYLRSVLYQVFSGFTSLARACTVPSTSSPVTKVRLGSSALALATTADIQDQQSSETVAGLIRRI